MLKERFYYSDDVKLANVEVIVNDKDDIVAIGGLVNKTNLPKVTICGVWDTEEGSMTFGVARCAAKDKFDKSIGRELARKRVSENFYRKVYIKPDQKVPDVFMDNCRAIEDSILSMSYPIILG